MPSVLAMGDTLVEVSMQVANAWDDSPDIQATGCVVGAGGSAANFVAVATALGVESVLATEIGSDYFGGFLIDDLRQSGVSTRLIRQHPGDNSTCVITVGADGDRRFLSHRGAESEAPSREYVSRLLDAVASSSWLHISGFWLQRPVTADLALKSALAAKPLGIPVSLDPSPQIMENPNELVDQVLDVTDVFFPNAYEACAFTSTTEPEEAARRLVSRVPTVVVTDGSNGVIWASSSGLSTISAVPVEAVDTTGAGDALAAGFVAAQLLGKPPSDALRVGIQAAAVLISSVGGHSAIGQLSPLK
jgi:ribokinase